MRAYRISYGSLLFFMGSGTRSDNGFQLTRFRSFYVSMWIFGVSKQYKRCPKEKTVQDHDI